MELKKIYDHYYGDSATWRSLKEFANPVISGTTYKNNQSYPPVVVYDESDSTYYAYVGSTQTRIVAFSSPDGITWTEEGIMLNTADANVGTTYIFPILMIKDGSNYILFYVNNASLVTVNYLVRTATSTSPLGPFTPNGVFYNATDFNLSTVGAVCSPNGVIISDAVKVGSTYYWFGTSNDFGRNEVWYGTSNSIGTKPTAQAVLFKGTDPDYTRNLLQAPRVFKTAWGWVMTFTTGYQGQNLNERYVKAAYCTTANPTSFTLVEGTVLNTGSAGQWDERRVYNSIMLKKFADDSFQDLVRIGPNYAIYYSGHDLTVNEGLTGLAYMSRIPTLTKAPPATPGTYNRDAGVYAISGGLIWMEADDNCYYTSTNLVYQNNNKFNEHYAITSTDGLQPTYVTNAVKGKPALSFSSGNKMFYGNLGSAVAAGLTPASFTIFTVISIASLAADAFICGGLSAAGSNPSVVDIIRVKSDGAVRCFVGDGSGNLTITDTTSTGLVVVNTPVLITAKYTAGQDHVDIYINGVLQTLTEVANTVLTAQMNRENFNIGCAGEFNGLYFTGLMPAFLMFEAALNNTDRGTVETYLMNKYI